MPLFPDKKEELGQDAAGALVIRSLQLVIFWMESIKNS